MFLTHCSAVNYSPYFCLQECSSTTSTSASLTPATFTFAKARISATSTSAPATTHAATTRAIASSAPSVATAYASANLSAVEYGNSSDYGSTVEGSGNVLEFTGGALKASMMGAGAVMAVVATGIMMML